MACASLFGKGVSNHRVANDARCQSRHDTVRDSAFLALNSSHNTIISILCNFAADPLALVHTAAYAS
jgi:hypothetical protein